MKYFFIIIFFIPLFTFSQFLQIGEWDGLAGNDVAHIKKDLSGNIWVGTGSGLSRINSQGITSFNTSNGLTSNAVKALEVDHYGNIWVGSVSGLSVYDGVSWTHPVYSSATIANNIKDIEIAENGDVWIATSQGIRVFNGSVFYCYTPVHGLPSYNIKSLAKDDSGTMWAGTSSGLCRFDDPYFTVFNTDSGMSSNNVKKLFASDQVYFYTSGGLNTFDGISFELYPNLEPTPLSTIKNIFQDEEDNIWLCFSEGLVKLNQFQTDLVINGANATIPDDYNYMSIEGDTVFIGTNLGLFYSTTEWIQPKNINSHGDTLDVNSFVSVAYSTGNGDEEFWHQHQSLWIGGMDEDNVFHMSAGNYGNDFYTTSGISYSSESWSFGPIDSLQGTMDHSGYWHYPRKVYKYEIDSHIINWNQVNYEVPISIKEWPKQADFYDADFNGVYNPENGDYPIIRGDVAVLSIYNDGYIATEQREPLWVEVHALTYAFDGNDSVSDNTYFINYKIKNKSGLNYSSVYLGIYKDLDIGEGVTDDYAGTDSLKNMVYAYNADNTDAFYGTGNIPAIGMLILNTKMTSSVYFSNENNQTVISEMSPPHEEVEFYNYLTGYWKNGSPITYGGIGFGGSTPAKYVFTGDPLTGEGWTELNSGTVPADRRMTAIVGPFNLLAGEDICLDAAVIKATAWGATNLMSVKELQGRAHHVHSWYQNQAFTCDSIITQSEDSLQIYAQDVEICEGHVYNIQLTTMRVGGVYPFTYEWTDENASFTETFHSPWVSPPATNTNYYVTVTDGNGNSEIDTLKVIVNELPELDLGNDTLICVGEDLLIDAGAYDNYQWNTGITTNSLLINDAGTYSLTVTENGCSVEDEIEVGFSIPEIGFQEITPACEGEPLEVYINSFPSILWETGEVLSQITIDADLYDDDYLSVTVWDSIGCERTDSTLIIVNPIPEIDFGNDTTILDTQNVVLDAYVGPGAIYNWYNGATDSILVFYGYQGEGVYVVWLELTDINGCQTGDEITITVDFFLTVNSKNQAKVDIYPNPTSEFVKIEMEANEKYQYQLIDELSRIIIEGEASSGSNRIMLTDIPKGVYFLNIKELQIIKKIIIE